MTNIAGLALFLVLAQTAAGDKGRLHVNRPDLCRTVSGTGPAAAADGQKGAAKKARDSSKADPGVGARVEPGKCRSGRLPVQRPVPSPQAH